MSIKGKVIIPLICLLAFLLSGSRLHGQCDVSGQVVEPFNDPVCGKLILSYQTWEVLVPSDESMLENVAVNEEILFSYEIDSTQSQNCTAGPVVEITCLTSLNNPAPDCQPAYVYSVSFNTSLPDVLFEITTPNPDLAYTWNFGDGTSATGAQVSHLFPAQDFYEICLSVSGPTCATVAQCQTLDLRECHAGFDFLPGNGTAEFFNNSTGNFSSWEWDLGDGTTLTNADPGIHDYGNTGIFTVCLTVWNNNGCSSTLCQYVYTGTDGICSFADCVYPGDANTDGAANVYDLLPIGVGYGAEGPPRQMDNLSAAFNWSAQFAPDWGVQTINGNDFKHLDCNGDGQVDASDAEAIMTNYADPGNMLLVQAPGSPTFRLDFEWDTIVIDDNTPTLIELEADLLAGTPAHPMQNLNGFALQLAFDPELVAPAGILTDYNDNSFLGTSNDIVWLKKNRHDDGKYDLGFTRKAAETQGFGRVATLKFIIIGDVIARNDEDQYFTVTIENAVAVNGEGAQLTIGQLLPATVVVVNKKTTTPTSQSNPDNQVALFPNPASDHITIRLHDLRAHSLSVFNSLGQTVTRLFPASNSFELNVAAWEPGMYWFKIKTDKGVVIKRAMLR